MADLQYAGDYVLKEALLVSSTGVRLDLIGTILTFEIFDL